MTPAGLGNVRLIDVLEAAYGGLERPTAQWLGAVLAAVRPGLDQGLGVQAYLVDASARDGFVASDWQGLGMPPDVGGEQLAELDAAMPLEFKRRVHLYAPFGTLSSLPTDFDARAVATSNAIHGYREILGLNALDASHRGLAISAPAAGPVATPSAARARLWHRVAVHVATAARLRRSLTDVTRAGEATLSPDGKVIDANGVARERDAREVLRQAARAIDRARVGPARDDAGRTVELWQALVAGRWSLVDSFESDGRRFVVAVPNPPEVHASAALSQRERTVLGALALGHGNKLIAYELGLAVSTVATHLARAAKKLGVTDRVELTRLLATRPDLTASPAPARGR